MLLIAGVVLWTGAHYFKRIAPQIREPMGDKGKGIVALALVVAIILMVFGYRATDFISIWEPPRFLTHLNNLLVLIAIFLLSPAPKKGKIFSGMRHPMLTGVAIWAVAHLLVNGDLASIILFGVLLAWAGGAVLLINGAEPDWSPTPAAPGTLKMDGIFFVGSVVILVLIGSIHGWLGPSPFG
jgi:uncharacterized membrane protein